MSSPSNYPPSVSAWDVEQYCGDAPVVRCCWCGGEIDREGAEDGDACEKCEPEVSEGQDGE